MEEVLLKLRYIAGRDFLVQITCGHANELRSPPCRPRRPFRQRPTTPRGSFTGKIHVWRGRRHHRQRSFRDGHRQARRQVYRYICTARAAAIGLGRSRAGLTAGYDSTRASLSVTDHIYLIAVGSWCTGIFRRVWKAYTRNWAGRVAMDPRRSAWCTTAKKRSAFSRSLLGNHVQRQVRTEPARSIFWP